ncbi:hypothetical protein C3L33_13229, partial [Rhododendron williamsianum]
FVQWLVACDHYMDLYLWNPSTRQCTKTLSVTGYWPMGHFITKEIGLCYDSSVDDYKAVIANRGKVSVASFKRRIWATTTSSYAESLASPAAYGHKEDWVEEGKDALELAYDRWGWSSCFDSYGGDWEWLYIGATTKTTIGVAYSVDYDNTTCASSSWMKPLINEDNIEWFQMLGSCNGLLLVSHYTNLYLWNPSTGQCTKMLSVTRDNYCDSREYFIRKEISASSGLCYDSSADDYKAVIAYRGKVSIASFRRRIWATTTCCFAYGGERVMNSGPVVNGKLHWVVTRNNNVDFSDQIVYFDPITDEFVELPVPPQPYSFWERKTVILGLGVLEGCLFMARCSCESSTEIESNFIEVFVMREYGVGESWSSTFMMSNFVGLSRPYVYGNLVPLYFTKNGEVLIAVNRNKLVVYDPNKMPQKEILISSESYEIHVASYTEGLASPAAYGHDEDWVEEGEDALELVDFTYICRSCYYYRNDSYDRDWELLNLTEGADKEDNNWVWNGLGIKEENQEKFKRRYKARLHFLAAKEKNQKRQQRIRTESEIILLRKNTQESKHGKNFEVDDLHKQESDDLKRVYAKMEDEVTELRRRSPMGWKRFLFAFVAFDAPR